METSFVASGETSREQKQDAGDPECCCGHSRSDHNERGTCVWDRQKCSTCFNFCDCHVIVAEMREEWAEEARQRQTDSQQAPAGGKP